MTLETIYYIGQTVAVLALLGSLVFVILQIRLLRNQMKGAATATHYEFARNQLDSMLNDDELYKIAIRGNENLDDLTDWELYRYAMYALKELAGWELLYHLRKQGAIDQSLYDGREAVALLVWSAPGRRKWWNECRFSLDPEFEKHVDAKLKDLPVRATQDIIAAYPSIKNPEDYKNNSFGNGKRPDLQSDVSIKSKKEGEL